MPPLALPGGLALARGRVHEVCGPARRTFALLAASGLDATGPILWVSPARTAGRLHPEGVYPFLDPGRIVFISPTRPEDLLWSAEEALRSGAAPLVVADLPEAPALTPVRRLNLAAEAGAASARIAPLGLILTPGDGGAQGAETRWHIAPCHRGGASAWGLSLRRARAQPPADWVLSAAGRAGADGRQTFTLARSPADIGMDRTMSCVTLPEGRQPHPCTAPAPTAPAPTAPAPQTKDSP